MRSSLGAMLLPRIVGASFQDGAAAALKGKRCILLWMGGGPSHIDTFDPKPGNGPFRSIGTQVPGLRVSEHLPRLARVADRLCLVRSMTSKEGEHERATALLHTGNPKQETVRFPSLGSVVAKHATPSGGLPPFVSVGSGLPVGPGFLGNAHAPFTVRAEEPARTLAVPEELAPRLPRRFRLLDELNAKHAQRRELADVVALQRRARRMMGPETLAAFDLERERESVRRAYGATPFGQGCLLARRLVERGVRFVEVVHDGWDTHENNFEQVRGLSAQLDPAMATLVTELDGRGLLDDTLVIWMGEFGRTPEINPRQGRDHHAEAFSVVLAGGGVKGGQVIGKTDARGAKVVERPVRVADLHATLHEALGLDRAEEYDTPAGRPIRLVEKGEVVKGVLLD